MERFSAGAVGQAVKELRQERGMTQEGLGREAGYQRGAGVSLSRIENGQMEPSEERFEGLAAALGVSPDELAARARAAEPGVAAALSSRASLRERARVLEEEIRWRSLDLADIQEAFNRSRDQANDAFLTRLIEVATRIEGVPIQEPAGPEDVGDNGTEAAYRLHFLNVGVQHALAANAGAKAATEAQDPAALHETFTSSLANGLLSTRSSITANSNAASALGAVLAATRVSTPPTLGGALGALAMGTAASAALALFINHRKRASVAGRLDELEAEIAATEQNVQSIKECLIDAESLLEYIATHAGHAVDRWVNQLGPGSIDLRNREGEQATYRAFTEVAAAHMAVANLDFRDLVTDRGADLDRSTELIKGVVEHAWNVVVSHV